MLVWFSERSRPEILKGDLKMDLNKKYRLNNYFKVFIVIIISGICSETFSGPAETYINKAKSYQSQGNYVAALNEFHNAISKEPSSPDTYYYLGVITEVVLKDYHLSSVFYEKALSLLNFRKSFMDKELGSNGNSNFSNLKTTNAYLPSVSELNKSIKDIEEKKKTLIKKIYDSIGKPVSPVYIVLKNKKKVYSSPNSSGKAIPATSGQKEFMFLGLQDNWYKVRFADTREGWVKWKDINLVYENKTKPLTLSNTEKTEAYEKFNVMYINSDIGQGETIE